MHAITLKHNVEAAHRLPPLAGKCVSLHGHSWQVEVTYTATGLTRFDVVADFAAVKKAMRAWLDTHLDHGTMLGAADPLADLLPRHDCKVFVFGPDNTPGYEWPTVEAVAALIATQAAGWLPPGTDARPTRVRVAETAVNAAEWVAPPPMVREIV